MVRIGEWTAFFLEAGIAHLDTARDYAIIFDRNKMKVDLLPDLDLETFRALDIQAVGDIISIKKHARIVTEQKERNTELLSKGGKVDKPLSSSSFPKPLRSEERVQGQEMEAVEEKRLVKLRRKERSKSTSIRKLVRERRIKTASLNEASQSEEELGGVGEPWPELFGRGGHSERTPSFKDEEDVLGKIKSPQPVDVDSDSASSVDDEVDVFDQTQSSDRSWTTRRSYPPPTHEETPPSAAGLAALAPSSPTTAPSQLTTTNQPLPPTSLSVTASEFVPRFSFSAEARDFLPAAATREFLPPARFLPHYSMHWQDATLPHHPAWQQPWQQAAPLQHIPRQQHALPTARTWHGGDLATALAEVPLPAVLHPTPAPLPANYTVSIPAVAHPTPAPLPAKQNPAPAPLLHRVTELLDSRNKKMGDRSTPPSPSPAPHQPRSREDTRGLPPNKTSPRALRRSPLLLPPGPGRTRRRSGELRPCRRLERDSLVPASPAPHSKVIKKPALATAPQSSPPSLPGVRDTRLSSKCLERNERSATGGSVRTATGGSARLARFRPPPGFSLGAVKPCRESLGSSWAEQVELEELARPRAKSYPAALLDSLLAKSLPPTTPPTPYQEEEEGLDCSDVFFSSSPSPLPPYCIDVCELETASVWDSHCHLDFLARKLEREGVREGHRLETSLRLDGQQLGDKFGGCVANFCDPQDWAMGRHGQQVSSVLEDCRTQDRVFLAIGCHPHFADKLLAGARLLQLERLARSYKGRLVAIGECGLDNSQKNTVMMAVQRRAFAAQVELALKLKLPLVLHIREAEEEGREVLREAGVPKHWPIHRHCFTEGWAVAVSWLRLYPSSMLGLTGVVTFQTAGPVHEVARRLPLQHLLLETDAPYFLPSGVTRQSYGHSFAQPGHVIHVAAQIAALRKIPTVTVLRANKKNIQKCYKIRMDERVC